MKKMPFLLFFLSFLIILDIGAQEPLKETPELDKKTIKKEVISCYRLGIVYGLNGMYDEAIKHLEKAVRLDPLFSEAYRILGIVYSLQDNYTEAVKNLERAIQINPNSKDAYRILKVINGLKDAREKLKELSVQENEQEEKVGFKKDYDEIKMALNKMEEEVKKLKKNQHKRGYLAPKTYEEPKEKEKLKGELRKDRETKRTKETSKILNQKDGKRVNKIKNFADILEEEREVAFIDEGIVYPSKTLISEEKSVELTIISLRGLWSESKDGKVFSVEGELENTGSSCAYKPIINAKFFHKDKLLGTTNCYLKSEVKVGEIVKFRLSLPVTIDCQEELSYQLSIKEDELTLSKGRSIQLFMLIDGKKIEMPIIFY